MKGIRQAVENDFEPFADFLLVPGKPGHCGPAFQSPYHGWDCGESRKKHYYASDRQFNPLKPLADDLPKPVPDLYDGAVPQQIDRRVRRDLRKQIVPCNNTSLPTALNFFLEGKSAGRSYRRR